MGHANIETTMDIYAEATDVKKKEAIKALKIIVIYFRKKSLQGDDFQDKPDIKKVRIHQNDISLLDFGGQIWTGDI